MSVKRACMGNEIIITNKKRIKDYLPVWMKNIDSMFYYFLFLLAIGLVFFATSLFVNYFTTPYTGDYTAQQFAFYTNGYDDWWQFFTTGEFVLYDQNTFLGADNIGSNSFYYLFDPFFLPILLVPRQLVPQGMAVLTIFKIASSGMAFFLYMKYLGASRRAAKISGIAYAFTGWMAWYLWFNHFTEVATVFPLILLGVEIVLKEKKPWVLAASICLMGFVNYFFCICFVMCAFLYAMFRYVQRIRLNTWKDNLLILAMGFCGFFVGLLLPMMVVFPSAMHALTSPRASGENYLVYLKEAFKEHNFKKIMDLLTSWTAIDKTDQNKARLLYPFIDYIFPATTCRGTPLTVYRGDIYDNVAGSTYCFLPMTLLLFPAFKNSIKNKHFSVLVPLVFFIFALFTPVFYYLFHGFTQAYSRWTLFVTTSILAYTGLYLDKLEETAFVDILSGWGSLVIFIIAGGLSANEIVAKYSSSFEPRVPIWLAVVLEIVYVTILVFVLLLIRSKKKIHFYKVFTGFIVFEIALMGAFVIQGHGVEDYYYTNKGVIKNDVLRSLVAKTYKKDKSYYRSYSSLASSTANNDGMRNGYNGANFFHSIYNYNTADICNWSVITNGTSPGSWSGVYEQKRPGLDTLLGIKYYYVENDYFYYQNREAATSKDFRYNVPFNYVELVDGYQNSEFKVYKNMDYIDFALTYDTIYETNGDPTKNDIYENLYSNTYSRDVLGIEELYYQGAIVNKAKSEKALDNIKDNYPDIKFETPIVKVRGGYKNLNLEMYGNIFHASDSEGAITFYDILSGVNADGKKANSLGLNAKDYLDLLNRDNDTFEKYGVPKTREYRQWVCVIDAYDGYFKNYNPNGNIYFVNLSFEEDCEADIYFVDDNNQIITYDNHNDGYYSNGRYGKEYRTFYITPQYGINENGEIIKIKDAPKISKIIYAYRSFKINTYPTIYVGNADDYQLKIDKLKEYPVTDIRSSANKYTFKTNFEKNRVVVTRLAYEDGFKLKMIDANGNKHNVEVFNGQGGFVSFVSGTGNCSYVLEFETPYLAVASYISSIGVFTYVASLFAYLYIDLRKKEKEAFSSINR